MALSTPTITATLHATKRIVKLDVTAAGATSVTVWRTTSSGEWSPVRGLSQLAWTSGTVTFVDCEPPQGEALSYTVWARDAVEGKGSTASVVAAPDHGGDFLYDLVGPATGMLVTIAAFGSKVSWPSRSESLPVIGRRSPVVVSDVRPLPKFDVKIITETDDEAAHLRGVLAQSPTIAVAARDDYGFGSVVYLVPDSLTIERLSKLGRASDRSFSFDAQQVSAPTTLAVAAGSASSTLFTSYTTADHRTVDNAVYGEALATTVLAESP